MQIIWRAYCAVSDGEPLGFRMRKSNRDARSTLSQISTGTPGASEMPDLAHRSEQGFVNYFKQPPRTRSSLLNLLFFDDISIYPIVRGQDRSVGKKPGFRDFIAKLKQDDLPLS